MSDWISVKDRLPEEEGWVLACAPDFPRPFPALFLEEGFEDPAITHWMLPPSPPEVDDE